MVVISIAVGLVAATLATAQTIETSSASSIAASTTVSESMPPVATAAFNPAPVNSTTRFNWCLGQRNACPQICGGAASTNFCDDTALTYICICSNGTVPDVTSFADTLPFYICQETYIQCVAASPNDAQGQATCAENEQCGTRNATAEAIAATSAMDSATSTSAGSSGTGSATAETTPSATTTDNAAISNVYHLSTGAFAGLLMAAFKLLI